MKQLTLQFGTLATLIWMAGCTPAQRPLVGPDLPAAQNIIAVPTGHQLVSKALGDGVQIYSCAQSAPGQFGWKLDMPEAVLLGDQGQKVGTHYRGPTWEANDGSKVVGKLDVGVDAPDPLAAIRWLRVKSVSHEGSGTYSKVSFILRVNTAAGLSPKETCDSERSSGLPVKVAYKSDYYFYVPAE